MTTKRQVKKLIAPIMTRNPDIAMIENDLGLQFVLRPLAHINRGFMIWPTGRADRPHCHWYLGYTFSKRNGPYSPFLFDFYTRDAATMYWSHPDHHDAVAEALETDVLPQLRSVETIDQILNFPPANDVMHKGRLEQPKHMLRLLVALGRFQAAAAIVESVRNGTADLTQGWNEAVRADLLDDLWPLVETRDLGALANLMHGWERQFVETNGMAAIYEQMPFPFESGTC